MNYRLGLFTEQQRPYDTRGRIARVLLPEPQWKSTQHHIAVTNMAVPLDYELAVHFRRKNNSQFVQDNFVKPTSFNHPLDLDQLIGEYQKRTRIKEGDKLERTRFGFVISTPFMSNATGYIGTLQEIGEVGEREIQEQIERTRILDVLKSHPEIIMEALPS